MPPLSVFAPNADGGITHIPGTPDGYLCKQYQDISGHGGYNNLNYGYAQPYHTGTQYNVGQFGYSTPTPPPQPHAITGVTVVVDTNVLVDYLMVIQKFVGDIESTKWPSVVIIPSVVISELDWCVGIAPARSYSIRQ